VTPSPSTPRKGNLWRTVKAVCWGFFGVRKDSAYQEDIAKLTPLHILGVGLVLGVLFVVGLIVLVKYVVAP
jgi:hypothetical protein